MWFYTLDIGLLQQHLKASYRCTKPPGHPYENFLGAPSFKMCSVQESCECEKVVREEVVQTSFNSVLFRQFSRERCKVLRGRALMSKEMRWWGIACNKLRQENGGTEKPWRAYKEWELAFVDPPRTSETTPASEQVRSWKVGYFQICSRDLWDMSLIFFP